MKWRRCKPATLRRDRIIPRRRQSMDIKSIWTCGSSHIARCRCQVRHKQITSSRDTCLRAIRCLNPCILKPLKPCWRTIHPLKFTAVTHERELVGRPRRRCWACTVQRRPARLACSSRTASAWRAPAARTATSYIRCRRGSALARASVSSLRKWWTSDLRRRCKRWLQHRPPSRKRTSRSLLQQKRVAASFRHVLRDLRCEYHYEAVCSFADVVAYKVDREAPTTPMRLSSFFWLGRSLLTIEAAQGRNTIVAAVEGHSVTPCSILRVRPESCWLALH